MPGAKRSLVAVALSFASIASAQAQSAPDPSGHWEGSVLVPAAPIVFELDLANRAGQLVGAISMPGENLRGLPLTIVAQKGTALTFQARKDQSFSAVLSADGQAMSGEFATMGYNIPFSIRKIGEAKLDPPPTFAAISKQLEGTWTASVMTAGGEISLILKLANQSDGTARGALVNMTEGEVEVPVSRMTQDGARVTFEFKVIGGSYAGTLSADGLQLIGVYTQNQNNAAVTFKRAGR